MKRSEKEQEVQNLGKFFSNRSFIVLADYCGLTVKEVTELRTGLRAVGSEMKVVKNTLAQIATRDTELSVLKDYFSGTTAAVVSSDDPAAFAKVLVKFGKQFEKLTLKVGLLDGKIVKEKDIEAISTLPSREQLLSSLLGSMNAPAQKWVSVLSAVSRQLATVLAAIRDKK